MKKLGLKLFAIIALPFCFATFFLFNQPGAAWGQPVVQQLGGIVLGSPSCVSTASEDVICGVRGTDNNLHRIRFNPFTGSSTGFQRLTGVTIVSNPSCASTASGRVICGVVGTDNALYGIRLNPPSAFQRLGGVVVGNPSCAGTASEDVICGVRGTDNHLHGIRFQPGGGSPTMQDLGPLIVDDPSCAGTGSEDVICGVRGTDNNLYGIRFFNSATGFQKLEGVTIIGNPSCANTMLQEMTCGVVDTGNTLFIIQFDPRNASTTGFQNLGAVIVGNPSCVSMASEQVTCAVVGLNNALFGFGAAPPAGSLDVNFIFDARGGQQGHEVSGRLVQGLVGTGLTTFQKAEIEVLNPGIESLFFTVENLTAGTWEVTATTSGITQTCFNVRVPGFIRIDLSATALARCSM
jgi:hypothetical protein